MLDDETNPATRAELLQLTPSGDLLDLARGMREMGVESLLFCSPSGRIRQVVTDRQIASMAADPDVPPEAPTGRPPEGPALRPPARLSRDVGSGDPDPAVPRQSVPVREDYGVPVVRD